MAAAIKLSEDAAKTGHMPFGAVLADAEGKILAEAHNQSVVAAKRGGSGDVTRHAEMELVRKICAPESGLGPEIRAKCTLYTSTEPCVMCAGAIYWSQVGRVVFGASSEDLVQLSGPGGFDVPLEKLYGMGREGTRKIEIHGPVLSEEAMKIHAASGCWRGLKRAASPNPPQDEQC